MIKTVFTAKSTANRIVQRSRLRSISEPPLEPPATPTPNAPDIPASLPECRSTRKITATARKTWMTARTECIVASRVASGRRPGRHVAQRQQRLGGGAGLSRAMRPGGAGRAVTYGGMRLEVTDDVLFSHSEI